jgi:hypothetical protein
LPGTRYLEREGVVRDAAFIINLFDLTGETRLKALGVESYSLVNFPGVSADALQPLYRIAVV